MTRHDKDAEQPGYAPAPWWLLLGMLGALLLVLAGCSMTAQSRAKIDEAPEPDYAVATVGDKTTVGNAAPIALGGVGLVVGLEGTGGEAPADGYRAMLTEELRKQGVNNVKAVLASPDNALVIVEASLPPGARKGDPLDVQVKLPPGSKATSLRGGYLRMCKLYNYDFARNLRL